MFPKVVHLKLPQSDISYYPDFFNSQEADDYLQVLRSTIPWQQDQIKVYGKTYPQPRLTSLHANNDRPYSYSNITMIPHEFTKELIQIKNKIESITPPIHFTTCLLNLYRNGRDSNGWHADDEVSLGKDPVIASISLGQQRFFHFKHKKDPSLKHKMVLEHGSLLLMKGSTQHHWLHQIPKTSRPIGERINLTFRVIK